MAAMTWWVGAQRGRVWCEREACTDGWRGGGRQGGRDGLSGNQRTEWAGRGMPHEGAESSGQ